MKGSTSRTHANSSKTATIFGSGLEQKNSFFKKTQIFKAFQSPMNLNLLNFEEVADNEEHISFFNKEEIIDEFIIKQTIKNRSLANVCALAYALLFFINCLSSTLYQFFDNSFNFDNISSYFYLGVYVLLANIILYLIFERFGFKTHKKDWWKIHNFKVVAFCLVMTIAHIKYLIDLDSNPLYIHYKFLYFWGYLQYPLILFMIIALMQGLMIKFISIFILKSVFISFILISENNLGYFELFYVIFISFMIMVFMFVFAYVEEIHLKEKYEFYMNLKKISKDWQNIFNNVPHGIAVFKDTNFDLMFSNKYGNDVLKINISSPQTSYFESLSDNLGELNKIGISNTIVRNTLEIASEHRIEYSIKSTKKIENSLPEKALLNDIFRAIEANSNILGIEKSTIVYKTSEKIKIHSNSQNGTYEEKNFLIQIKKIIFENKPKFLIVIEDNSQFELIVSLTENNEYKSKLLSSFSHELRTPLNGAMPLLKNLHDDENFKRSDSEKHYQLSIAINSLTILQMVLNDIVDYAQINSNQLQLNCTETNIKQALYECLEIISLQIKEKSISLEIFIDPKLPNKFYTDRNRFMQIILNLLRNSVKFSNNGGKIQVSTSNLDVLKNNIIVFKIQDYGVGMSLPHLGNMRKLLDNIKNEEIMDSSTSQLGNLGLVISQNLAIILGPSTSNELRGLKIESKLNEGTTVEFLIEDKIGLQMAGGEYPSILLIKSKAIESHNLKVLPNFKKREDSVLKKQSILWLQKGENASEESWENDFSEGDFHENSRIVNFFPHKFNLSQKSKIEIKKFCGAPILVVDDDPFNLLSAEVIIKKLGFTSEKAFNGKEAVEMVVKRYKNTQCHEKCKKYLLILMDYNMPVMNGIEATKCIKEKVQLGDIPDTPIIACSAFDAKDDIANCFEAGMNDYISKPINLEGLRSIFNKWIRE